MLGAADAELLFDAVDAVVAEDPKAVLLGVEKMARSGRDPSQFARDLLAHLRHLLVTQTTGEVPTTFVVTATDTARLQPQAADRRRRDPGPHDRRAGRRPDRGPRGRRRPHGGRDRAAQSGPARSRPLDRGAAAPDRAAGEPARRGAGSPAAASCRGRHPTRPTATCAPEPVPADPPSPARAGARAHRRRQPDARSSADAEPSPAGGGRAEVPRGAEAPAGAEHRGGSPRRQDPPARTPISTLAEGLPGHRIWPAVLDQAGRERAGAGGDLRGRPPGRLRRGEGS